MKKIFLMAGAAMVALSSMAESNMKFVTTVDSINIYNIMVENAPGRPMYKDVPRFTLVGKDNKFYLGMGANVKFVGDFDWGAPVSNANIFAPKNIPMSVADGDRSQTLFSMQQSNIYWNFVILPGSKYQVGLFFDFNFLGDNNKTVALHHAYLKFCGFTAGYVASTFTDLAAEPASIDFGGPNSITLVRHPSINYNLKFGSDKLWQAQIGLDMPDAASFTEGYIAVDGADELVAKKINQRMPDIPLFLQRGWAGGKGWFRASAIFRNLQYRNLYRGHVGNQSELGWGVKVSGRTPIVAGLSASWQGVYGEGIASYIQDLSGEGQDLVPVINDPGKLTPVKAWGGYASLKYDICNKMFINATYSHVRAYAKNFGADWGNMYRYGQYVTANFIANVTDFAQVGVEYLWGRRMNYGRMQSHDNRLMLMLQVSI